MYEAFENFRKRFPFKSSAVIDTGANPGLITHFAIMGIYGMARSVIERKVCDYKEIEKLLNKKNLPGLAKKLKVEVIHISENEEITPNNIDLLKIK